MTETRTQYVVNERTVLQVTKEVAKELEQTLNGRRLTCPEIGRIAAKLLVSIPQWLDKEYLALAQMITSLEQLERGSGCYRAYATYDSNKTLTGFVFRPYYGGIWFPGPNEAKLCDFEV